MPGDMVVALGCGTADGNTLFAHNSDHLPHEGVTLRLVPGRAFAAGESIPAPFMPLPQVRQTITVLGLQTGGCWGYDHGVNAQAVAVGRTSHHSKLQGTAAGLTGPDLVRLALERSRNAQQAVDLITDLVERHGQGRFSGCPESLACDSSFVVADPQEAFLIEAAGRHWVCQQIQQVRACSDISQVRQDWSRISRGLASHAIDQGWWPGDGSKLDFTGAIGKEPVGPAAALRRWGRAMMMLEQQSGHIDVVFLRRLLADHYETLPGEVDPFVPGSVPLSLCQHGNNTAGTSTAGSMVASLSADPQRLAPVWSAMGPPCITVYFPVFLEGELPAGLGDGEDRVSAQVHQLNDMLRRSPEELPALSELLARFQGRLDHEAEEFIAERSTLKQSGAVDELRHQATQFMQHQQEQFLSCMENVLRQQTQPSVAVAPR